MTNKQTSRSSKIPRIFFLSYGVLGHDGRLSELLKTVQPIGQLHVVSLGICKPTDDKERSHATIAVKNLEERRSAKTQFKFILLAMMESWQHRRPEILFVDDLMSALAAIVLLPILKPKLIIQDSREFYYGSRKMRAGSIFLLAEQFLYKKSDMIICANDERADIMKALYRLKRRPIVFENIRHLPKNNLLDRKEMDKDAVSLVSTGGCSIQRGTINLIESVKSLSNVRLTIVGRGSASDYKKVSQFISENDVINVQVIERIPYSELSEFISHFDIGVVEYHQNDLNNIFCASGKVFEYTSAGLPIVCTPNISLKAICREYGIGEASNDMSSNIQAVKHNLPHFKKRALEFSNIYSPEKNRQDLREKIQRVLDEKII